MNAHNHPRYIDAAMDVPPDPRQRMTAVQSVRLRELCEVTGERFEPDLTLEQAEHRIAELQARSR